MLIRHELRNPPPMEPDPALDRFDGRVAELWHAGHRQGFVLFLVTVWVETSGPIWRRHRGDPYKVIEFGTSMAEESPWRWLDALDDAEADAESLAADRLEISDELTFHLVWLDGDEAMRVRREHFPGV